MAYASTLRPAVDCLGPWADLHRGVVERVQGGRFAADPWDEPYGVRTGYGGDLPRLSRRGWSWTMRPHSKVAISRYDHP
ncbi:hypothetical protein [Microlunatus sp. Gsoil 973]|uniref:hypothetical protein n=1 Tax=Microlunatus sp. Gsoil 973 TaxID=2672569 RepID=UPI0012B4F284|nr:hypothetical protein [Microlunatus sp. Gsoil 973]QGN34615.1 hypothetical protein GJV80_19295 [Microlunatus sp. Gsoil 973]